MKTKTITFAVLAASAMLPALGHASPARVQTSENVEYRDLNLSSPEGRDRLDSRISAAVRKVCGTTKSRQLVELADVHRCRREATTVAARGREMALASRARSEGVALLTVSSPARGD